MWKESEQFRYRMVLSKADKIIYITESSVYGRLYEIEKFEDD